MSEVAVKLNGVPATPAWNEQRSVSVFLVLFGGQVMVGTSLSVTVTVIVAVAVKLTASVAVYVIVVTPLLNKRVPT